MWRWYFGYHHRQHLVRSNLCTKLQFMIMLKLLLILHVFIHMTYWHTEDTSRNICRLLYPYNCRNILFIILSNKLRCQKHGIGIGSGYRKPKWAAEAKLNWTLSTNQWQELIAVNFIFWILPECLIQLYSIHTVSLLQN